MRPTKPLTTLLGLNPPSYEAEGLQGLQRLKSLQTGAGFSKRLGFARDGAPVRPPACRSPGGPTTAMGGQSQTQESMNEPSWPTEVYVNQEPLLCVASLTGEARRVLQAAPEGSMPMSFRPQSRTQLPVQPTSAAGRFEIRFGGKDGWGDGRRYLDDRRVALEQITQPLHTYATHWLDPKPTNGWVAGVLHLDPTFPFSPGGRFVR